MKVRNANSDTLAFLERAPTRKRFPRFAGAEAPMASKRILQQNVEIRLNFDVLNLTVECR